MKDRNNEIPPMTDRLSRSWRQPSIDDILVDDHCAMMSRDSIDKLHEYSASTPSAVYSGKMWKRKQSTGFYLCWFRDSDNDSNCCTTEYRPIVIL